MCVGGGGGGRRTGPSPHRRLGLEQREERRGHRPPGRCVHARGTESENHYRRALSHTYQCTTTFCTTIEREPVWPSGKALGW